MTLGILLASVSSALVAANTAADLGERIVQGRHKGALRRAQSRVQPMPRKAATWLRLALKDEGHPVADVKPGLDKGQWVLLVTYKDPSPLRPPPTFEGYPVRFLGQHTRQRTRSLDYPAETA